MCFYRNKPHINFIEGCQHGTGGLCFFQPLSDPLSHAVHLHLQQNHKRAEQENAGLGRNHAIFNIGSYRDHFNAFFICGKWHLTLFHICDHGAQNQS